MLGDGTKTGDDRETNSDNSAIRLLLTRAGTGSSNNLIRSLRAGRENFQIYGCHDDFYYLVKSDADYSFLAPDAADEEFAEMIGQKIREEDIDLLIPVGDDDALAIARIRDRLPCRTYLPATEVIELCQDKFVLAKALEAKGIRVPKTLPICKREDIAAAFAELGHHPLLWCRTRTGYGSRAATMVKDEEQAWHWIKYWNEMRDVAIDEFTLAEFLPGRDFNVQGLWRDGKNLLIKMCERLSYLDGGNRPSGMSSTPGLAKTVNDTDALDLCEKAIQAVDPGATGVFNIDLKQDANGDPAITEINSGRFATITNIYDLTGEHNMARSLVALAMGETPEIKERRDIARDFYLIRDGDTHPEIVPMKKLIALRTSSFRA